VKPPYQGGPGGTIYNYGSFENPGNLNSGWDIVNEAGGTFTDSGQLSQGGFDPSQYLNNYGSFTVTGQFFLGGGTFLNAGNLQNSGNFGMAQGSSFTNSAGSSVTNEGGTITDSGLMVSYGTFTSSATVTPECQSGFIAINGGGSLTNYGTLDSLTPGSNCGGIGLGDNGGGTFTNYGTASILALALNNNGVVNNEAGATIEVTAGGNFGGGCCHTGPGGTVTNYGTITVDSGGSMGIGNELQYVFYNYGAIQNAGLLTVQPSTGTLVNEGSGQIINTGSGGNGLDVEGTATNYGLVNNQGDFFMGGVLSNYGTISSSGTFQTLPGSTMTNWGVVDVTGGGGVTGTGAQYAAITNEAGGTWTVGINGGESIINTFTNNGLVTVYGTLGTKPPSNGYPDTLENFGTINIYGLLAVQGTDINEVTGVINNYGSSGPIGGIGVQTVSNNGNLYSGTFSNFGQWLPGRIVSESL
jgi:hypothetical protein